MSWPESFNFRIPSSLLKILALQWKARARQTYRSFKTKRGMVYGVLMGLMFCLWMLPSLISAFVTPRVDPETARAFFAPALLCFFLLTLMTSGVESGVAFLPAEVDLLFPGPFKRRELLLYRIINLTAGGSLVALFFSAIILRACTYWIAAFIGLGLGLTFLNLLQMALGVFVSTVAESTFTTTRRVVLVIVLGLLGWGLYQGLTIAADQGFVSTLIAVRHSLGGKLLLAPFEIIAQTATATSLFPDFVLWASVGVAMNLLVLWGIVGLDANYMEKSIGTSQRIYERIQRARRGQGLSGGVKARGRLRPPSFGHLGGAGPIAWRQMTVALRSSHFAILLVLVLGLAITIPVFFSVEGRGATVAMPAVSLVVFLLPQLLQYDFRGDIDRLDVLKSLPLSPWGVVAGQLFTPICISTLLLTGLVGALYFTGVMSEGWASRCLLMTLPSNMFLYSIENLMFLVFPYQTQANTAGDLQVVGRNMLSAFTKIVAMMIGIGIALGFGGLAYWVTSEAEFSFLTGMVCGFIGLVAIIYPLSVYCYHRLDPATLHGH